MKRFMWDAWKDAPIFNKDLIRVEKFSFLISNVKKRNFYTLISKTFTLRGGKIDLEDNIIEG